MDIRKTPFTRNAIYHFKPGCNSNLPGIIDTGTHGSNKCLRYAEKQMCANR